MKGSKSMSWVNLDDDYVNKTGDTIAGDLSVKGTLTIDDKTGNNTTYDVANKISELQDSTSKFSVQNSINHVYFNKNNDNKHRELWFDDMCIYFTPDCIGVYNSTTQQGFQVNKS